MIAVDTNILVYAHRRESTHHQVAGSLIRELAEGKDPWSIPWPCIYEFFSVVTNAKIWKSGASSPQQAWQQIEAWTASPTNRILGETEDFLSVLEGFVVRPRVRGAIVHDARIAAICIAHGAQPLLTADRDFAVFPELATKVPF